MSLGLNDGSFRETTKPMLRPNQAEELKREQGRIEGMLNAPDYIKNAIQEPGELRQRLRSVARDLESQTPTPYRTAELDAARTRHNELLGDLLQGMPTQAEMRRRPVGAVDKHMAWERRNKQKILEWKNLRLRLHQSGHLGDYADAGEIANLERFRPAGGANELNMHGTLIDAKQYYLPPLGAGPVAVMTDDDEAVLRAQAPEVLEKIGLMDNETRAEVLNLARELAKTMTSETAAPAAEATATPPKPIKAKRAKGTAKKPSVSPEERARRSANMRAMNAAKKAARERAKQAEA